jgi:hypothetical protein
MQRSVLVLVQLQVLLLEEVMVLQLAQEQDC